MPITQPLVGHDRVDIESRYTLLEKVGSGTFATVYRARDNELGREVAVKQVHSEYMEKPESLDAFWGEAQLLASLQHPNIVTIYDIYRDRGWLILELMQTNLADRMQGKPLSVQAAKTTVAHCLRALAYLHERGITHGDIKPSNMMIDARKRVKIGDFGLARRVSDEEGSLVKGTTKFMAPEIVSDEFGEIGPPSDLYSLGFSMYSLLCGENFEQLFPGLNAFGRNKQIAWMMWQAAPDRRIPEIGRVLQGVPEDLAHVVDKLVQKKQSERYPTAQAALDDLGVDQKIVKEVKQGGTEVEASPEDADRRKRLILLGCMMAFSVVLSLYMVFSRGGDDGPSNSTPDVVTVQGFLETDGTKILKVSSEGRAGVREIPFEVDPEVALREFGEAEKYIVLRELKQGDRLEFDRTGERLRIVASRPMETEGRIESLRPGDRRIEVAPVSGRYRDDIELRVTDNTRISRNGRRAELTDLEQGNVVRVWHLPELDGKPGRVASRIEITETEETVGFFGSYDEEKNVVRIRVDDTSLELPVGENATVTLVEHEVESNVSLEDLRPDDRVRVLHDDELKSLVATRDRFEGRGVVVAVDAAAGTFTLKDARGRRSTYRVPATGDVVIGSPASVADLRADDEVFVTYRDGESGESAVASSVTVDRKTQGNRWAILVATSGYKADLPELPYLVADVRRLGTMLVERYTLPENRCVLLIDQKAVELRSGIERALDGIGPGTDEVVLYLGGHVLMGGDGKTYLGGVDFDPANPAERGVPLDWIVGQLEDCPAATRLLLLDTCHEGSEPDAQPASEDVASSIEGRRTVRVLASCSSGQRGRTDEEQGLFADALADGYAGPADADTDLSITPAELADYVRERLASRGQTPVLVSPGS